MRVALLLSAVLTLVPTSAWSQGNPLGPEFRVNAYTTNDQAQASVAIDSAGNFVVVWESGQSYTQDLFGQRYSSSGAPLGDEFRVNGTFQGGSHASSVASDSAGNFVVIWEWEPLENAALLGQRYSSSGAPLGGAFDLGNQNYSLSPAVAADPAFNFVVVWNTLFTIPGQEAASGVFGQRYAGSGAPLGSVFHANTYTTGYQIASSVAADASGNFVVVWQSMGQDGSGDGVFGQRFASSGAAIGSEFRVNTHTTSDQSAPSVATDAAGNFVVVWQSMSQDGSGDGVFGQRFGSSGAPLGPEFRINMYITGGQRAPSVAADAGGNFVVTWHSPQDGSNYGIFGQRYADSGIPLGLEFVVNTYTPAGQVVPSVAADSMGDFVVVWQSFNQDGSAYGVFGQRYRPILPVELMRFRVE